MKTIDISKKISENIDAGVNSIHGIGELLKKKSNQISTNGIGWKQIATTAINSPDFNDVILLYPNVGKFFDENVSKSLKVSEHKWTANDKINFYCLINKTNNESIREHIIDKYKYFLFNRISYNSVPRDSTKNFVKISECLSYTRRKPYNDEKFIKNLIDNIFPRVLESNVKNEDNLNCLINAMVFNYSKEEILSLSNNLFNEDPKVDDIYTTKQAETILKQLDDRAKIYRQQRIGNKHWLIPTSLATTLVLGTAFSWVGTSACVDIAKTLNIPTIEDIAQSASDNKILSSISPIASSTVTTVLAVTAYVFNDFIKNSINSLYQSFDSRKLKGEVENYGEHSNLDQYLKAVYTKSNSNIVNSLIRKGTKFYDFESFDTKRDITINLMLIEKTNNPAYQFMPNQYLSENEATILNTKNMDEIIKLSSLTDPYIRSLTIRTTDIDKQILLMDLDIISNSFSTEYKHNKTLAEIISLDSNIPSERTEQFKNLFSKVDQNTQEILNKTFSLTRFMIGTDEGKQTFIIEKIFKILESPKEKQISIASEIVNDEFKSFKKGTDSDFKLVRHVGQSIFLPIDTDTKDKIVHLAKELNLKNAISEINNNSDIKTMTKNFCKNKTENILSKINKIRDCLFGKPKDCDSLKP